MGIHSAGMRAIRFKFRVDPFCKTAEKLLPTSLNKGAEVFESFGDGFEDFLADFEKALSKMAEFIRESRFFRRMRDRFHGIIIA